MEVLKHLMKHMICTTLEECKPQEAQVPPHEWFKRTICDIYKKDDVPNLKGTILVNKVEWYFQTY
jgi:hypothetical protein